MRRNELPDRQGVSRHFDGLAQALRKAIKVFLRVLGDQEVHVRMALPFEVSGCSLTLQGKQALIARYDSNLMHQDVESASKPTLRGNRFSAARRNKMPADWLRTF